MTDYTELLARLGTASAHSPLAKDSAAAIREQVAQLEAECKTIREVEQTLRDFGYQVPGTITHGDEDETIRTDSMTLAGTLIFVLEAERKSQDTHVSQIKTLQQMLDTERELHIMQMAEISYACMMNSRNSDPPLAKDHSYWTPAYQNTVEAVGREMRECERTEAKCLRLESELRRACDQHEGAAEKWQEAEAKLANVLATHRVLMREQEQHTEAAEAKLAAVEAALSDLITDVQNKWGDPHTLNDAIRALKEKSE